MLNATHSANPDANQVRGMSNIADEAITRTEHSLPIEIPSPCLSFGFISHAHQITASISALEIQTVKINPLKKAGLFLQSVESAARDQRLERLGHSPDPS